MFTVNGLIINSKQIQRLLFDVTMAQQPVNTQKSYDSCEPKDG